MRQASRLHSCSHEELRSRQPWLQQLPGPGGGLALAHGDSASIGQFNRESGRPIDRPIEELRWALATPSIESSAGLPAIAARSRANSRRSKFSAGRMSATRTANSRQVGEGRTAWTLDQFGAGRIQLSARLLHFAPAAASRATPLNLGRFGGEWGCYPTEREISPTPGPHPWLVI